MKKFAIAGIGLLAGTAALAQEAPQPVAPPVPATVSVAPAAPAAEALPSEVRHRILAEGTEIPLVTRDVITTRNKQARTGQIVHFAVASDISVDGVTVIPAGTPASGELLQVAYQGSGGKAGLIAGQLLSLRIADRDVPISGKFDDRGSSNAGGVAVVGTFLPFGDMFVSGSRAEIAAGSPVKGKLLVSVDFTSPAPRPLPVVIPLAAVSPAAPPPVVAAVN